jgi:hypothetical protein
VLSEGYILAQINQNKLLIYLMLQKPARLAWQMHLKRRGQCRFERQQPSPAKSLAGLKEQKT